MLPEVNYNYILLFHKLANFCSISETAKLLDTSPPKISRDLKLLEEQLNTTLFIRKKTGLQITPQGKKLLEITKKVVEIEVELKSYFLGKGEIEYPILDLNILTTNGYSGACTTMWATDFLKKHENIRLNMITTDSDINEAHFFADLSISNQRIYSNQYDEILLRKFSVEFVASKEYLEKRGVPKEYQDLKDHDLIAFNFNDHGNKQKVDWFLKDLNVYPKFRVNNFHSIINFVEADLGIACLQTDYIERYKPHLIILKHLPSKEFEQYLTYKKASIQKKQVNQFINFLKDEEIKWI